MRATPSGSPRAQQASAGSTQRGREGPPRARNSDGDGAGELAELDGFVAQAAGAGVELGEVEQALGQIAEAARLGERLLDVGAQHRQVGIGGPHLVRGELEDALQRRQRRAQLVRGGRDERAPRVLLLGEPLLQARRRRGRARRARRGGCRRRRAVRRARRRRASRCSSARSRRSIRPLSSRPGDQREREAGQRGARERLLDHGVGAARRPRAAGAAPARRARRRSAAGSRRSRSRR